MKRFFLLGVLAFALILVGLGAMRGGLLLLALPLLLYLGAGLLWGPQRPALLISRRLQHGRFFAGDPVHVTLEVVNDGLPLEQVGIEDPVGQCFEVREGETRLLTALPAGGRAEISYTVSARRGQYRFPDVLVTASDNLGLFRWQGRIEVPTRLVVYPELPRFRRVRIRPARTLAYAGPVPARRGGAGIEFFGLRAYQPGDPLRWINWKASSRHEQALFTNEYEQDRMANIGLILDTRLRSDIRREQEALFEYAVQATAGLAGAFLDDGNRVGLLLYGRVMDWTFPGYGKVQRERILAALARAQPGESMVFDRLDNLPVRFFPPRSQLILVSPLFPDDLPTLVRLRARGYALLVVSPDPVSFEQRGAPAEGPRALGGRIARVERDVLLRRLRQAGIQVLDWPVERPLDAVVRAALTPAPSWHRAVGVEL